MPVGSRLWAGALVTRHPWEAIATWTWVLRLDTIFTWCFSRVRVGGLMKT
jgi:hypothetical protein